MVAKVTDGPSLQTRGQLPAWASPVTHHWLAWFSQGAGAQPHVAPFGERCLPFLGPGKVNFLAAEFPFYRFPFSCPSLPKGGGCACPSTWFAAQALLIRALRLC